MRSVVYLQIFMTRKAAGQMNHLMGSPLGWHHNTLDLLHLRIIWRWHTIEITWYLSSQIWDNNKLLKDVLRQDVSVSSLFDVIWWNIYMVCPQVEICGRDCSYPPFSLRWEGCCLIVTGRWSDNLITMFIDSTCGGGSKLWLLLGLFFNLCNLLTLCRRSRDLHTKYDITDFWLCQGHHIDTVNNKKISTSASTLFKTLSPSETSLCKYRRLEQSNMEIVHFLHMYQKSGTYSTIWHYLLF